MNFDYSLPEGWSWKTIEQIQESPKGATITGPFGSSIGKKFFVEQGIPVIRGNNLSLKMIPFIDDGFVFVSEEKAEELKRYKSKADDLLFTAAGTIGQVGIIPQTSNFDEYIISNKQLRARLDRDLVDPLYAYYWFSSKPMVEYIKRQDTGSTIPLINLGVLRALPIPVAPLDAQVKIRKILESFDKKIEVNQKTNKTLEQMAQAIFKSWFVDFDPVKAKMNGEQPEGMDAATASLFPEKLVESELGLIPEGWEAKPLGDFLTIKRGGSPRPIKDFIVPDGYPWTKIADATANDNPYIFKTKEFIKEEGLKKTVYLKKGTLILSNSATPGLPRFLDLDACIHDGWLHFPEKKHFTDSYLYQLFLHLRKHLISQGNGSVFTNLKTDILRNQMVLVPPKDLVDIYEMHAGKFLETVKAKSVESNQLAKLRDTLLPKLLSGEIDLEMPTEN
ncbi:restriction endonuclease subunit S [Vibrio sp. FF112]|uniref:Type I restriction-modification system, specificity subunit S n=1 Tax=Vibrio tasmaniensis TaxID=212663 RepID=A0A0H3ZUG8_9VIBR|nr:Type I restriction-modification system, specificity subunit S [Vibrio tasmaniensis]